MKTAVVLFNLGGPDSPQAIRPFLQNLFADPNIIGLPTFLRHPLAWLIAKTRAPKVLPTYQHMGGKSPILENTQVQADALQKELSHHGEYKVFINMRYWHPMVDQVVQEVKSWQADRVILLPLYPQFSTTTTASSKRVWDIAAKKYNLTVPTHLLCCYPTDPGFVSSAAQLIKPVYEKLLSEYPHKKPRILFSAHGLPKKIVIQKDDPYPQQVQISAHAIVKEMGITDLDWKVSFQSRVGPLEWIKPYTIDEIKQAGADQTPLIIFPVAFVSEHLETLVELDIEYRHVAEQHQVPSYNRVPTVSHQPDFINSLTQMITTAPWDQQTSCPTDKPCDKTCRACPLNNHL